MTHYETIVLSQAASRPLPDFLQAPGVGSLVVEGSNVVVAREVPGLSLEAETISDGVKLMLILAPGVRVAKPMHLCIGSLAEEGIQRIVAEFHIGAGARIEFIACCSFPNAVRLEHVMEGLTFVRPGATLVYRETHYHNGIGGVRVKTRSQVVVEEGGCFLSGISMTEGRAGSMDVGYQVDVAANGLVELVAKGRGYGDDEIIVREDIRLNGHGARGLAKSRIAVHDTARCEVRSTLSGNAPGARGHVDCVEIVSDDATADAVPLLHVNDDRAQLTHEAAIGSVDRKELETIMSRAVDERTATDIIVRGLLGDGLPFEHGLPAVQAAPDNVHSVPAIEVRQLTRDYGQLRAVDGISFSVETGEVFGFLGPNGAGKTTTVRMLTTLLMPTSGTALLNGFDVVHDSYQARRQFGVVPEDSNVYRELTARQNLYFSGRLYRLSREERESRAVELMTLLGMADKLDVLVDTFSRGMRRKLTIAMALMHRPPILFLDEPTAGLDVPGQRSIMDAIRKLSAQGTTLFLTTHQLEEANQLCDRIAIIDRGGIAAIDTPDGLRGLLDDLRVIEVVLRPCPLDAEESLAAMRGVRTTKRTGSSLRLGTADPSSVLPALVAFAEMNNLDIVSLNTRGPSLEEVFLHLTGEAPEAGDEARPARRRRRRCSEGRIR